MSSSWERVQPDSNSHAWLAKKFEAGLKKLAISKVHSFLVYDCTAYDRQMDSLNLAYEEWSLSPSLSPSFSLSLSFSFSLPPSLYVSLSLSLSLSLSSPSHFPPPPPPRQLNFFLSFCILQGRRAAPSWSGCHGIDAGSSKRQYPVSVSSSLFWSVDVSMHVPAW